MFVATNTFPSNLITGFPITQAVINGTQHGTVFSFRNNYFIVHKAGFCSFLYTDNCMNELIQLLITQNIPQYFHIYDVDTELIDQIERFPHTFKYKKRVRLQLEHKSNGPYKIPVPDGFCLWSVSQSHLKKLSAFGLDLTEKFWNNESDFISNSYAQALFTNHGTPVSICYAAAVSDKKAEVDVNTIKEYQGRGFASLVIKSFANCCFRQGISPHWDCFVENEASLRTALSLQFERKKTYQFLSIYKINS